MEHLSGKWTASGKQAPNAAFDALNSLRKKSSAFRHVPALGTFTLERLSEEIAAGKDGTCTITQNAPGKASKRSAFRLYTSERDRFSHETHFALDGKAVPSSHANYDVAARRLTIKGVDSDGVEVELARTFSVVNGGDKGGLRKMELVVTFRESSQRRAQRGRLATRRRA